MNAPTVTITIPERNKAVKRLLEQTYPGVKVSVTAGTGTAYHWINITFDDRVNNPSGMTHSRVEDAIIDLIIGAGIHVHTYVSDGDFTGKCIEIVMPRTKREDTMRAMVATTIALGLQRDFPNSAIVQSATTSDCPMLNIKMASGDAFNVTITRARK